MAKKYRVGLTDFQIKSLENVICCFKDECKLSAEQLTIRREFHETMKLIRYNKSTIISRRERDERKRQAKIQENIATLRAYKNREVRNENTIQVKE